MLTLDWSSQGSAAWVRMPKQFALLPENQLVKHPSNLQGSTKAVLSICRGDACICTYQKGAITAGLFHWEPLFYMLCPWCQAVPVMLLTAVTSYGAELPSFLEMQFCPLVANN